MSTSDYIYINMKTKAFCSSEEELRTQVENIPGVSRVVPMRGLNLAMVASGGYFKEEHVIEVFNDLCKSTSEGAVWKQRIQEKAEAQEKQVIFQQPAYSSAGTTLIAAWLEQGSEISKPLSDFQSALKEITGQECPNKPLNCSLLDAVVGRLVLHNADPRRLPKWGLLSSSGCIPRKVDPVIKELCFHSELLPIHLLSIILGQKYENGMNMEFAYFATFLPSFDKYVIARAAPMNDIFDSVDVAIGSVNKGDDFLPSAMVLLAKDWMNLRKYYEFDEKWSVSRVGLINDASAKQIAGVAWPEEEEEIKTPKQQWPYCASENELRSYLNSMTEGRKEAELREMSHEELCALICNML